jgi:hypothetical protein
MTDKLGFVNGTLSYCKLDYCARRYRNIIFTNSMMRYESEEAFPLYSNDAKYIRNQYGIDITLNAEGIQQTYILGNSTRLFFASAMKRVLQSASGTEFLVPYFRSNQTWPQLFRGVAEVGGKVLQSPSNLAVFNISGVAIGQEIYVESRFEWLVSPFSLIAFTTLFLIATIIKSKRRPYVFKNSILAVLFHGLEGIERIQYRRPFRSNQETDHDLKEAAKSFEGFLTRNNSRLLKIKIKRE